MAEGEQMMDLFEFLFVGVVALLLGTLIGKLQGDQATLRDCATRGEAKMASGGVIDCAVRKENK